MLLTQVIDGVDGVTVQQVGRGRDLSHRRGGRDVRDDVTGSDVTGSVFSSRR